jgi:hypothetical protein
MAVNNNPYQAWENLKSNSDWRSTDTQITSLVRQQLSESRYQRTSNRVNPGPYRNLRAKVADSRAQLPHPLGAEDFWGWQEWTQTTSNLKQSDLADNLLEAKNSSEIPGKDYTPYGEVTGASS